MERTPLEIIYDLACILETIARIYIFYLLVPALNKLPKLIEAFYFLAYR